MATNVALDTTMVTNFSQLLASANGFKGSIVVELYNEHAPKVINVMKVPISLNIS